MAAHTALAVVLLLFPVLLTSAEPIPQPEGTPIEITDEMRSKQIELRERSLIRASRNQYKRQLTLEQAASDQGFTEDEGQRFPPHNFALPETIVEIPQPFIRDLDAATEMCIREYDEMVLIQRLMETYGCSKIDNLVHLNPKCEASTCGQKMMHHYFYKNCSKDNDGNRLSDHLQMDCVETNITEACGTWGVYGPTLVDERADPDTCVCQMLKKHTTERLHYAERACPQFMPKLLCIPNFVKAIALCSWPGATVPDVAECISSKMGRGKALGASIPLCYIQMCHTIEDLFGVELKGCGCAGVENKRTINTREWYRFSGHDNTGTDIQLTLPTSARDVTHSWTHPDMDRSSFFTDYADPQACNRFIRCFNNGPCFNGTDGGGCPSGMHFQAVPDNPRLAGCYPAEQTDCGNVPVTRDSLGTVPVCFVDNEDFSDMVESVGRTPAAIKTYVDGEGKLTGLALGYRDRDLAVEGRSVWAPVHGRKTENEAIRALQGYEEIRAVHVETIKANTEVQQVARLTFDIYEKDTNNKVEFVSGLVPANEEVTNATLAYPAPRWVDGVPDTSYGCAFRFICGGKTSQVLQVLTVHVEECLYTPTWRERLEIERLKN